MSMRNPPHPGELIGEDVIKPLGISVTKAADILHVRRATLSDLIHGWTGIMWRLAGGPS